MVWAEAYSDHLVKIMKKLKKRDPIQFQALCNKRDQILENPLHFKNLQYDLSDKRRVHVYSSFVLVYSVDIADRVVHFLDYDHHDNVYEKD